MAFVTIEKRVEAKPELAPASIRLRARIGGRVSCVVGLRKALCDRLDWRGGALIQVQIGDGDDAGKMRIVRVKSGDSVGSFREMKNSSGVIDLGFIAQFGTRGKVKMPVDATVIDKDTIELRLPKWEDVDDDDLVTAGDDDENGEDDEAPVAPPKAPEKPPPLPQLKEKARAKDDVVNAQVGVSVSFRDGVLRVAKSEYTLSEREALVLAPLVPVFGGLLGAGHLIQRAELPLSDGAAIIAATLSGLEPTLKRANLQVKYTKGIGYCLNWR